MKKLTKWPYVLASERTPLTDQLFEILKERDDYISELESELRKLKRLPAKPSFNQKNKKPKSEGSLGKRPGSAKERKTQSLQIHYTHILRVDEKPHNALFKGYRHYTVQEIDIKVINHLYKCERWQNIDGTYIQAPLPKGVAGHHFGPTLRAYVLHQYYNQGVTQGLLWLQLKEWDIKISRGQLNRLIIENKTEFYEDKKAIYEAGTFVSSYFQVDDTGARHKGLNGYCTYIGNEYFAHFQSTHSKSRINFLKCLQGRKELKYVIDNDALIYLSKQNATIELRCLLRELLKNYPIYFHDERYLINELNFAGITRENDLKLVIEATLYSYLKKCSWFRKNPIIISDEAGQFSLPNSLHSLCWLHIERKLKQIFAVNESQEILLKNKREAFWNLYNQFNEYKLNPKNVKKISITRSFNDLCKPVNDYESLNEVLLRIKKWKDKLLLALNYPHIPLHNNTSERDIRDYVRRRKVSGGTRSDTGREARDAFISIKKTCQKVNISFWSYLLDKTNKHGKIKIYEAVYKKKILEERNQFITSTY